MLRQFARYMPIGIVALAAMALLAYALWPQPIMVEVVAVTRGLLQVTVDEDGKTRVKDRYVVSAPLTGQLSRIELEVGDCVQVGNTVLAVIQPADPALLDARLQAEAESRVKAAEAAQQQAAARLEAAQESQQLAAHEYKRAQNLVGTRAISQAEYDNAEHQMHIAEVMLRAAQFASQVAKFEVDLAKAAFVRTRVDGDPSNGTNRLEIRSPVDGRVLRIVQESAAVVDPGLPLIEVGNTRELEIEIDVLSADAAQIKPGARLYLQHWGGESPLLARVRRVEPSGFTKVSALGVEEQRVNVIADFDEPLERLQSLGDAFCVEARIVVWEKQDALKVPAGALFRRDSDWAVYVCSNHRAELRQVKIGRNNGQEAEVVEGLHEGERVIAYPSDKVRPGVAVRAKL
jgi:HlyD family secretion protein